MILRGICRRTAQELPQNLLGLETAFQQTVNEI